MNTRIALKAYTKGETQDLGHVAGPLAKFAKKYAAAYEAKERAIIMRKNQDQLVSPVLDVLRQKIAAKLGEKQLSTPIAMRFDAYQAVRKASEHDQADSGLSRLARHLEASWTKDPMGSITLGEVMELRRHYSDSYPKSKVAKVLDTELPKVGYAQLPVAKLAKIAAQIQDQADFDQAILMHQLAGDDIRSVQARTLIRELVDLKGTTVEAKTAAAAAADDRTNMERVTDRIAKEAQLGGPPSHKGPPMPPHKGPPMGEPPDEGILDGGIDDIMDMGDLDLEGPGEELPLGAPEEGGAGDAPELAEEVREFTQNEVAPNLPGIEEYNEVERAETGAGPVDDPIDWAFAEGQEMGEDGQPAHTVSPSKPGWVEEELSEHGVDGPPAGEPPMVDDLDSLEDDVENIVMARAAGKFQAVTKSPPGFEKWVMNRKAEGMDPDMAYATAWAKHSRGEAPTKQAQWDRDTQEWLNSFGGGDELPGGLCQTCGEPNCDDENCVVDRNLNQAKPGRTDSLVGRDPDAVLDQPRGDSPYGGGGAKRRLDERIKGRGHEGRPELGGPRLAAGGLNKTPMSNGEHPKVTTYAPERGKDGGAELTKDETKALSVNEIEAAIIDRGETVKVGNVSILINNQDEVELWVKDAGRACDLQDIDVAIADFIRYATLEREVPKGNAGSFAVTTLQPVPCGKCASVNYFQPTTNPSDLFECECGHRTKNATIMSLVKHGQLNRLYHLKVELPSAARGSKQQVKNAMAHIMKNMVGKSVTASFEGVRSGIASIRIDHANNAAVSKIVDTFKRAGFKHVAQLSGGPVPGGADMPVAEMPKDTVPAGKPAGGNAAPPPAAAGDVGMGISMPDMPSTLKHYKSKGIGFVEALANLKKDFPEFVENHLTGNPQAEADLFALAQQLWFQAPAPTPDAAPPPEGAAPGMAATAFKDPAVRKPKDHVSVGKKPLGTESDSEHKMKSPAIKKKHPAKQKSPTDLGKHSDDKDPGSFGAEKPPKDGKRPGAGDAKGTKAPSKGMHGKDSDNDPAKSIPLPNK